jgi:hypothetical protein
LYNEITNGGLGVTNKLSVFSNSSILQQNLKTNNRNIFTIKQDSIKASVPIYISDSSGTVKIKLDGQTGKVTLSNLTAASGEYRVSLNPVTKELYAQEIPHAFVAFTGLAENFTMASNASWYKVTKTGGIFTYYENIYIDSLASDTIRIMSTGHFQFHYHVVFEGTTNNYYNMRLFNVTKNAVIPIQTSTTGQGAGNRISIGNTAYCLDCSTGDKVILQMQSEGNSNTVVLREGSILILQTHGEN